MVEDPAEEALAWMCRIREEPGAGCPWVFEVFRSVSDVGVGEDGRLGFGLGWKFGGAWVHRYAAEAKLRETVGGAVQRWRCGLARAYHCDYRLVAVERNKQRTVLVEEVRRHFWSDDVKASPSHNRAIDGYVFS